LFSGIICYYIVFAVEKFIGADQVGVQEMLEFSAFFSGFFIGK
jgi:hypothetical protein